MTIKKLFKVFFVFLFLIAFAIPVKSFAAINIKPLSDSLANARMLSNIVNRLTEIHGLDKNDLSINEKRQLKKELRDMKHKAEGLDKRIYISVGAIILIIILVLLIL